MTIALIFMLLLVYVVPVMAVNTITIEQVVEQYNNSETVKQQLTEANTSIASYQDNVLTIVTTLGDEQYTTNFNVDGDIISISIPQDDQYITNGIVAFLLIDAIQQLQGTPAGDILTTLMDNRAQQYTLEEQGLLMSVGETLDIHVDMQKQIPLLSMEDIYITVEDLENGKDYISGDGSYQMSSGNVTFYKSGYDNEVTITVGEDTELTNNAYRTILSGLEVMFGTEEAAIYFQENYTDFSEGNKQIEGIDVAVAPEKTEMEQTVFGDKAIVRLTIDKDVVNAVLGIVVDSGNNTVGGNTVGNHVTGNNYTASTPIPAAGMSIGVIAVIAVIFIAGIYGYIRYTKMNKEIK